MDSGGTLAGTCVSSFTEAYDDARRFVSAPCTEDDYVGERWKVRALVPEQQARHPARPAACWAENLGETRRRTQAAVHLAARGDSPPGANRAVVSLRTPGDVSFLILSFPTHPEA